MKKNKQPTAPKNTRLADLYRRMNIQRQRGRDLGGDIRVCLISHLNGYEETPQYIALWRYASELMMKNPYNIDYNQRRNMRMHLENLLKLDGLGIRDTDEYTEVVPLEEVDFD